MTCSGRGVPLTWALVSPSQNLTKPKLRISHDSPGYGPLRGSHRICIIPSSRGVGSRSEEELEELRPNKRRDFGHIARIMETELGERLEEESRCSACRQGGEECWVYSTKGRQQVRRPGDTCARCRVKPRPGGCSLSRRKRKRSSPLPAGPRIIMPCFALPSW